MVISLNNPVNGRFYFMYLTKNLFDEFELIISKGSIQRKPIIRYLHFTNYIDAVYTFSKIAKLRLKHGYTCLNTHQNTKVAHKTSDVYATIFTRKEINYV